MLNARVSLVFVFILSFQSIAAENPQSQTHETLTQLLSVASADASAAEIDQCKSSITAMEQELANRTPATASAAEKVAVLNDYLFNAKSFAYAKSLDNITNVLLPSVVKSRYGNCLGLSCLYLCLGESLGLKLSGAEAPTHFYVILRDGQKTRNIDMALKGNERPIGDYCKTFGVPPNIAGVTYLRELTLAQTVAAVRGNMGVAYWKKHQHQKAITALRTAISAHSESPILWGNLGGVYGDSGDTKHAIEYLQKAISLDGSQARFHMNLAAAYVIAGNLESSTASFEQAIKLSPDILKDTSASKIQARTYYLAGEQALKNGKFSDATAHLELFVKLAPADRNVANAYNNLAIACYMAKDYRKASQNAQLAAEHGRPVDVEVSNAIAEALRSQ